jgi:hypothetical protein
MAALPLGADESVIRGRNEGLATMQASNVAGNGNVTAFAHLGGSMTAQALHGNAGVGGQIGIAGILQLRAAASFLDYSALGPAEAHLQITTPGNDKLRFFGAAVSGDVYLSTAVDTLNFNADETRPFYSPFLLPSLVADFDWLGLGMIVPLKNYVSLDLVDDPQLLFRYDQLAAKLGLELKLYRNAFFAEAGLSLYKEKPNRQNRSGDDAFRQYYAWVRPGARYRIRSRFSIVGSLGITFLEKVRPGSALEPQTLSLSLRFEAPLVFKETNTEAIRSLAFVERKKKQETDAFASNVESGEGLLPELKTLLDEMGGTEETFDYKKEREALSKRREALQKKMINIEGLLDKIE